MKTNYRLLAGMSAVLIIIIVPAIIGLAQANTFSLGWFLIGGGGGSSGGVFSITGSMSQSSAGTPASGGNYSFSDSVQQQSIYQTVFVDSAWASYAPGIEIETNRRFFSNAFADIQNGIDRVAKNGQVLVNMGSYTGLNLNRPVIVNVQANTSINGNINISLGSFNAPNGVVQLHGDFYHSGGNFMAQNGSFVFTGLGEKQLTLESPTRFYDLTIEPQTTLIETDSADHILIDGNLTNRGVIQKTQSIQEKGHYSFGLVGASVNFSKLETTTTLKIQCIGKLHSKASLLPAGSKFLPFYFVLTSQNETGNAQICFNYSRKDLVTIPNFREESLHLCQWVSPNWNCVPRSTQSDSKKRTVCADNENVTSDWIIVASEPVLKNFYYIPSIRK